MRVAICDDNITALKDLNDRLKNIKYINSVTEFDNIHRFWDSVEDGSSQEYTLDDYYGRQTVALKNKIETSFIKMEILSVYTGTTYKDTLVSEIKLY